jgi:hypothetical protein
MLAGLALDVPAPDGTIQLEPAVVAAVLDTTEETVATLVTAGLIEMREGRLAVVDFDRLARRILGMRERARRARARRRTAAQATDSTIGTPPDGHASVTGPARDGHAAVTRPSRDDHATVTRPSQDQQVTVAPLPDLVAENGAAPPDLVGQVRTQTGSRPRRRRRDEPAHSSVINITNTPVGLENEFNTLECAPGAVPVPGIGPPERRHARSLFRALVEECTGREYGTVQLSRSERGRYNRAAKELAEIGVTAEEIRRRAQEYRRRWPNVPLTPTALVANWTQFEPPRSRQMTPDEFIRAVLAETERLIEQDTKGGSDAVDR